MYKHVHIYFLAAGQPRAVGSLENGNLVMYRPLNGVFKADPDFAFFPTREIQVKDTK